MLLDELVSQVAVAVRRYSHELRQGRGVVARLASRPSSAPWSSLIRHDSTRLLRRRRSSPHRRCPRRRSSRQSPARISADSSPGVCGADPGRLGALPWAITRLVHRHDPELDEVVGRRHHEVAQLVDRDPEVLDLLAVEAGPRPRRRRPRGGRSAGTPTTAARRGARCRCSPRAPAAHARPSCQSLRSCHAQARPSPRTRRASRRVFADAHSAAIKHPACVCCADGRAAADQHHVSRDTGLSCGSPASPRRTPEAAPGSTTRTSTTSASRSASCAASSRVLRRGRSR